uniref:Uncharacterized protein AlNc14C150G7501 n=1 Tax=Albugo laibachii Nc14 TaxID=890382 RepID=F0WLY8_9STRA|nr:conserved hypothetical protein [Albugo laibachii Nc14]|eukprot:CCA22315.1 conserved hypothetical protein [Albugo laibachii Nc14]
MHQVESHRAMGTQCPKLTIICLEGCHGSGKTVICNEMRAQGYPVLDEAFIDMPSYSLDPQSLLMETIWVCNWFQSILQLESRLHRTSKKHQIVIVDRSPFSAIAYARNGHLLQPLILQQMQEIQSLRRIQFHTVRIDVDPDVLYARICVRLEQEPERMRFHESDKNWMHTILTFYNAFPWDFTVKNESSDIRKVVLDILHRVSTRDPNVHTFCRCKGKAGNSPLDSDADTQSEEDRKIIY